MSKKKLFGGFSKAPTPMDVKNALATPAPKKAKVKKIDSTIILGIRTTPENRDAIKMYALQNKISIGEFLDTAIDTVINGGVTPQKKSPLK